MHTEHQHNTDFLDSLQKIERAKAPDFFQTRLMARLEKEVLPQQFPLWQRVLKPVPVLALLGCLVILNLYTLGDMFFNKTIPEKQEENIAGFASEYNLFNTVDADN